MSRPKKAIVDYFPHQCTHQATMFILEQKYGNDGYAFWFKLLEMLGATEGHFIDCNDGSKWEFLQARVKLEEEKCIEILNLLVKVEAIDAELWSDRKIWSQKFVDGIAEVYKKRTTETPNKPAKSKRKPQTRGSKGNGNPQSKVEYTKGDKSKVEEIKQEETIEASNEAVPYFVLLRDRWFEGYEKAKNTKPSFGSVEGRTLKSLIDKIKTKHREKEIEWTPQSALTSFTGICTTALDDKWLGEHFTLKNINSQFDIIYGKAIKQHETPEEAARKILDGYGGT